MISLKKIVSSVFLLFLVFFLISPLISFAATSLKVGLQYDNDKNTSPSMGDACHRQNIGLQIDNKNLNEYDVADNAPGCLKTINRSENSFNLKLIKPARDLVFISVIDDAGSGTYRAGNAEITNRSLKVYGPNAQVIFGLKAEAAEKCDKNPGLKLVNTINNDNNVVYALQVKNNNSSSCAAADFYPEIPAGALPTGWNINFMDTNNNPLIDVKNVVSGETKNFKLKITPKADAQAKKYTFKIVIGNVDKIGVGANLSLDYIVTDPEEAGNVTCNNKGKKCATNKSCLNPGKTNSKCVDCINDSGCSGNKKCTNNKCVVPPAVCNRNAPKLEVIEPDNSTRTGKTGQKKEYKVKITNNDKNCDNAKFVLTADPPGAASNWTTKFDPDNEFAVDNTKSVTLEVTPKNAVTDGRKTIKVGIKRPSNTNNIQDAGVSVFYVVERDEISPSPSSSPNPTASPTNSPSTSLSPSPSPTGCDHNTPALTISQDKESVKQGGKIIYSIKVKNTDVGSCKKRKLNLQRILPNPDNWKGTWDPNNEFEIDKNKTKTFKLTATSPNNAAKKVHVITINVRNPQNTVLVTKKVNFTVADKVTTPTPTVSPSPTDEPEPTDEPTPTPTDEPEPTETPEPTPTPTPDPDAKILNIKIGIDGIGTTPRIPVGNKNPRNVNRTLNIKYFDAIRNSQIGSAEETVTYNPDSQQFEAITETPNLLPDGIYNIFVTGSSFLSRQYPGSVTLTKGGTVNLTSKNFYLITGNVTNENESEDKIDISDYHVLLSCSIYGSEKDTCNKNSSYMSNSDLDDDGIVNENDLTYWLKEVANQEGDIIPQEEE